MVMIVMMEITAATEITEMMEIMAMTKTITMMITLVITIMKKKMMKNLMKRKMKKKIRKMKNTRNIPITNRITVTLITYQSKALYQKISLI